MEKKKSLLERYGVPINHLDFQYLKECKDAREVEKIVNILRSGEEGFYPDLTICAEEKLRELKPESRLFRLEEQIKGRETLGAQEWKPIYDWNLDIRNKDQELQKLKDSENNGDSNIPPVRKPGKISQDKKNDEVSTSDLENKNAIDAKKPKQIPAVTDYRKWDRFDADEEILRMDLAEERVQDEVERKNRVNAQKCKAPPKIEEIVEEVKKIDKEKSDKIKKLTDIEKEKLSEELRLRGNEYFRAQELDNALIEYTKAIQMYPEKAVAAYNNRALTYFKKQKFFEAIQDCESCLKLEPANVKGRLRLAEAHYASGRRKESFQLYANVLEVDATNAVALKAITELRNMYEDLPPPHATRLSITDGSSKSKTVTTTTNQCVASTSPKQLVKTCLKSSTALPVAKKLPPTTTTTTTTTITNQCENYDLADLVQPNRIVKNKLLKAAENFGNLSTKKINKQSNASSSANNEKNAKANLPPLFRDGNTELSNGISTLRLPGMVNENSFKEKKLLIQEI